MIKFFFSRLRRAPRPVSTEEKLAWMRDPLSHPVLETMCERELADLPFRR